MNFIIFQQLQHALSCSLTAGFRHESLQISQRPGEQAFATAAAFLGAAAHAMQACAAGLERPASGKWPMGQPSAAMALGKEAESAGAALTVAAAAAPPPRAAAPAPPAAAASAATEPASFPPCRRIGTRLCSSRCKCASPSARRPGPPPPPLQRLLKGCTPAGAGGRSRWASPRRSRSAGA